MASDLPNATQYKDLVTADAKMKATIWSEKVLRGTSQATVFRDFTGEDGSGMPVITKRDLEKGMAEEVTFTEVVPVRGQGKLGENELKSATRKLGFSTFGVGVDLLRQGVAYTRLLELVRLKKRTPMQISSDLMTEWWARKNDDDLMTTMRNKALLVSAGRNVMRVNNRASRDAILSTDLVSTSSLESGKGRLKAVGASAITVDTGKYGAKNPKYLFFAPDSFIRPLRSNSTYLSSLQNAEVRSPLNPLFTGSYQMWDNNIIVPHNLEIDAADGRQGSPLLPIAYLGTAIADGTPTTLTGGGETYVAGDSDYFSYFPGFGWKITDNEVLPTDNNTYYAMIYNVNSDGKYEIISYTSAGVSASGHQITSVTRGSTTQTGGTNGGGNVTAQAASRFSLVHPSGAIIISCTREGVPLGWGLHMGAGAVFHARGMIDAEPIFHYDDFKNANDEAHLTGIGIQGVRGMTPFRDKLGRYKNFMLIEGAVDLSDFGVTPVAKTS
jgi:N4-gp56 family major capsid protein